MKDPIKEIQLRTLQYWHIDGLIEITFGLVCLVFGFYFIAIGSLPTTSPIYKILNLGMALVIIGITFAAGRILNLLKQRITFPRTGYVSYRHTSGKSRWLGAALAMVIGLVVAGMMASEPASLAWTPAITSLLVAAVMLFLGHRFSLLRYYLLAAVSVAFGMGLSVSGIGDVLGLGVYYLLFSLPLAISGILTLRLYLRGTQPPEGNAYEDRPE